jgi:hypothetical protein
MKNYIITEWGSSTYTKGTAATAVRNDADSTPRAEGGFFKSMDAFGYGLYLGNNGAARTTAPANSASTDGKEFLDHQNAVDLFIAGDMGTKWGAKVHYANSKDESQLGSGATAFSKKNSAFGISLGATQGDLEGYVNLNLSDKSDGATVSGDSWNRKPGVRIGGSYKYSGMILFADYASTNEEITSGVGSGLTSVVATADTIAANSTVTHKTSDISFGVARIHEVNPGARLITDARLVLSSDEIGGSSAVAQNGKVKTNKIPVTFAMEMDATSWLVFRGSISQNVILGESKSIAGQTTTIPNSSTVNVGGTLNFGKLKADGMVGTTGTTNTAGSKTGVLSGNNLLTRVGVAYNF